LSSGWGKAKGSKLLTIHYFKEQNGKSICELASGTEQIQEKPDEYWKCSVCKRLIKAPA